MISVGRLPGFKAGPPTPATTRRVSHGDRRTSWVDYVLESTLVQLNRSLPEHYSGEIKAPCQGEKRQAMRGQSLTDRQQEVLDCIRSHIQEWGVPPSRAEIARALGFAFPSAADNHLKALERKGWIQLHRGRDHGIQLLREGAPILDPDELPAVAAGNPIVACDRPEPARLHDFDSLAERFEAPPDWFVRVEGDSLDKVGFRSGDVLAVQRNPNPRDGDIVVARIGDEVVVKRFSRPDEHTIELQPESHNPEHEVIRITPHTVGFEVVGTVVGAVVGTRRESTD